MINFVKENDKKWAQIIPVLNHTKSEHMIKNRYNSLINKKRNEVSQKDKHKDRDIDIINLIIEELKRKISQE